VAIPSDKKIRLLIVEDHRVTLDGLSAGLSAEGDLLIVGSASNSDEGLKLAKELKPEVILLDLHLPGSNGPRTTAKTFCELPNTKVIIFSGESRLPFINAVLNVGVSGYLLKSESISRIAQTIRDVSNGAERVLSESIISNEVKVTKSEQEVLKMLARGMKYDEIAERRNSSPATVRKQCELLLDKLYLDSRERLIAWAVQNGYGNLELDV
jgi:DNA-binding NarL/FixJ family response regulator